MSPLNACLCIHFVLLWFFPVRADAAPPDPATSVVHVCEDARGQVAYQGMPCSNGQRTRDVKQFRSMPIDPAVAAKARRIEQDMDRRNGSVRVTRMARTGRSGSTASDPCKSAKARRKAMLDRAGLNRGYATLEQIDREVWALCKGL